MSYKTVPILNPHQDKDGLHKIHLRLTYNRKYIYASTPFKVGKSQFNGWVTDHPNKARINTSLKTQINQIESRLLEAMKFKTSFSKAELNLIAKGISRNTFKEFTESLIRDKIAEAGTLRQYQANVNKVEEYHPGVKLVEMTEAWLKDYERHLKTGKRKNQNNTINTNMKRIIGILNKAARKGLVDPKAYQDYTAPPYVDNIPEYLEQFEVEEIFKALPDFPEQKQTAGIYFLLGCKAGYRISDLKKFNPRERIKGDRLLLRATKNGKIVSLLIYPELQRVLDMIRDRPFTMAEETMRKYVKEICAAAGIKRNIKVHTARHTFGMMLADKGFSIDEIAELLGDSQRVARIYAKISNARLDKQVRDKLS